MRNPIYSIFTLLLVPAVISACASSGGERRSSTSEITSEDMQELSVNSVYDAVRRLRPQWLSSRGTQSIQNPNVGLPVVFVDDIRFGPVESLHGLQISDVASVAYINARDATTRFGTGYSGGIISVRTR